MIIPLKDAVTATTVYINPSYVVTVRPDPMDPDHVSLVRLRDGESVRISEDHRNVFEKLAKAA